MLSYFPSFYKNEILYSLFARYHIHSGNFNSKQTLRDLFNSNHVRSYPHIPRNLEFTYKQCMHFSVPSLEKWIAKHTLYYYYTNFNRNKTKDELYQLMIKGSTESKGYNPNVILKTNKYFKYCPSCLYEDYEEYGESYWKRDHQLYSVYYCLKHEVLLQDSTLKWHPLYKEKGEDAFEAASYQNCLVENKNEINLSVIEEKLLIKITEQMVRVASNKLDIDFDSISRIYRYLLHKQGYISGGKVNSQKLFKDFRKKYSSYLLLLLDAEFEQSKRSNWLSSIVKKHNQVFSPIKHILLILLLQEDISTIHLYNKEFEYFGKPPYSCLNPFSEHYLEKVIDDVEIISSKNKEQIGLFKCECGFSFTKKPEDALNVIYQIKEVGKWESHFEELKGKYGVLLSKDKQQLREYNKKYSYYKNGKNQSKLQRPLVKIYRKNWLELLREFPELSTDKIKTKDLKVYTYLFRHDKDWLSKHTPKVKNVGTTKVVDWEERDDNLILEVKQAYKALLEKEKPVRITPNRLKKLIKYPHYLSEQSLRKLPQVSNYLNQVVENVTDFQIRRLDFVYQNLQKQNKKISENSLKIEAGLGNQCSQIVQEKINNLLYSNV